MRLFFLLAILTGAGAAAQSAPGLDLIRGVPDHGRAFTMKMYNNDPIGSIYQCMDRIHKPHWWSRGKGTGLCVIAPHSIRAGKHLALAKKYEGVLVDVR